MLGFNVADMFSLRILTKSCLCEISETIIINGIVVSAMARSEYNNIIIIIIIIMPCW